MAANEKMQSAITARLQALHLDQISPESLYMPIAYGLESGGKRLRPMLALLSCECVGGDWAEAVTPAIGIEMFHNFTLLHDDVMDNSDLRRGRPTVRKRYGDVAAILSGDAMLTMATQLVMEVKDSVLRPVLEMFNSAAMKVYEGQALDMDFETRMDVTLPEYVKMIGMKTGDLLGMACGVGALIGGCSSEKAGEFYDFGLNLGIAFQLLDDYLDVYGDEKTFGKPIGGDILNDKKTYLLVNLLNNSDEEVKRQAAEIMKLQGDEKISSMRDLYTRTGLKEMLRKDVALYTERALDSLKKVVPEAEKRAALEAIANKLTDRDR